MLSSILKKISAKRIEKKFSQQYMANSLNITQGYYNKLENGKNPLTVEMLLSILEVLNIDIIEIIDSHKNNKSA